MRSSRSPSSTASSAPLSSSAYRSSGPVHQALSGHGDGAEDLRGPEGDDPLRVVPHADGDSIALADALLLGHPPGEAGDDGEVLGERVALVLEDEVVTLAVGLAALEQGRAATAGPLRNADHRDASDLDLDLLEGRARAGERRQGLVSCHHPAM